MLWLLLSATPALSDQLPAPTGRVLLTISGNIEHTNDGDTIKMDLAMLESLEATSITTDSPWTDEPTKFTGVRISHLLEYIGANSNEFRASAIDKYWNDLLDMDFESVPAIIAYKKNDKYMRIRDLGPLWIMFPFDQFPELLTEKYKTASVWQLIGIEVH
ncbi:MAG: oxidoreductase [Pseudomonadota bacterium]